MNFFDFNAGSSQFNKMAVSSDFWIFWAISVPITILTVLTWYVWQKQQSEKGAQQKARKLPTRSICYNGRQDNCIA